MALLLGIALTNISTILVYIGLAMFAALGLDPVIKWLGRHGVKRGWAIAIIFLTGAIIAVGLLLLVVPTLAQNITSFVKDFPTTVANFEKTPFYKWLEGIFGTGLTDLINEVEKFFKDPKNVAAIGGGLLKVGAGIASAVTGLLIVVVLTLYFTASLPGIKDSLMQFAPARRRVGRARHDRPDHRLRRRLPHGHGHPGVLQLRGGDHPAPGPAPALPAAHGCARLLDHDHPADRTRAVLDRRDRDRAVHEPASRR